MNTCSGSNSIEPDTEYFLIADMGTTNLVVSSGIETVRIKNPQTRYGSDIVSRIYYSLKNGPEALQSALLKGLLDGFRLLYEKSRNSTAQAGSSKQPFIFPVQNIVLTGNTVMMHFLTGLETSGMAAFPFTPVSFFDYECIVSQIFPALDFSLWSSIFSPETRVYLPPCIDSFTGADLVCASAGCGLYGSYSASAEENTGLNDIKDSSRLLIDIGTNTEILLVHKGNYFACSTAAGPAFEGGSIKSSLRGSELLHSLGLMLDQGQMDTTGMLLQDKTLLCQSDVRQLQLAKAAMCAAVETLLHEASVSSSAIYEVFLCGAFGTNIVSSDIVKTGLLNTDLAQKITVKESAVIEGSLILAKSKEIRRLTACQAKATKVIQLADNSFFAKEYIECMNF
jgi:uncharacterized 2Fe-2S/4Fe-4S cluster protein (DUF4445 family)